MRTEQYPWTPQLGWTLDQYSLRLVPKTRYRWDGIGWLLNSGPFAGMQRLNSATLPASTTDKP